MDCAKHSTSIEQMNSHSGPYFQDQDKTRDDTTSEGNAIETIHLKSSLTISFWLPGFTPNVAVVVVVAAAVAGSQSNLTNWQLA